MVLVGMQTTLSRQSIQIIVNTYELETKQETEIERPINKIFVCKKVCRRQDFVVKRICCRQNLGKKMRHRQDNFD